MLNGVVPCFTPHSERGGSHAENEDVVLAQPHPRDDALLLCTLADGQGGRSGGKAAAQTAATFVLSFVSTLPPCSLRSLWARWTWNGILTGADEAVSGNANNGFTTLIGLGVGSGFVTGASCGDSGVLLVRNEGEPTWLTENQRKNPPVGSGAAHPVPFSARFLPGDTLLLMSDGAFRYVDADAIGEACRDASGSEIISALRSLQTEQNQSRELNDDFSVLVVQISPTPFAEQKRVK